MKPCIGVALTKCFYCGKDNEIMLNTRLTEYYAKKVESMHQKVVNMDPCPECEKWMKQGIILLTIDESKSDPDWNHPPKGHMPNPYRAGGFCVIKDEAFIRIFSGHDVAKFGLKHRWIFIEHEAAEKLGLL